jgi:hypothetical protein
MYQLIFIPEEWKHKTLVVKRRVYTLCKKDSDARKISTLKSDNNGRSVQLTIRWWLTNGTQKSQR